MKILRNPEKAVLKKELSRPSINLSEMDLKIAPILEKVRQGGDEACLEFTERFDGAALDSLRVPLEQVDEASSLLSPELLKALETAYSNIRRFHEMQKPSDISVETMPGVSCRQVWKPLEAVGLYIPGGSSPLFSTVLMLGVPARLAGCDRVVLCTPPDHTGRIHPAILHAASLCGIRDIFRIGGAQAVAAMAFGTKTIPPVHKIFGPGNQWVTAAKQAVQRYGIAIDMPAGPSEVAVIADKYADPEFIAADLLSQAEHGPDSQAVLFTDSPVLADAVNASVENFLSDLPRKAIAGKALEYSRIIVCRDLQEAVELSNSYAPEHLIIQTENAEELVRTVRHAGSVFIGQWTPESAGDYASGTNHTLPTSAFARNYSGLTLQSFMKSMTLQSLDRQGVSVLAETVETMAEAEGLQAHALAMRLRFNKLNKTTLSGGKEQ